jgi:VWFA-related protein
MELRMIRPITAALCSVALAIPALCPPAGAAKKADRKLKEFAGEARVVEVQVPVNVVGRDGASVRGLTVDDFEVFDGGKQREIVDFQVVDLEQLSPGTTRTEIDRAVPAAARRHFLLLFDLSFSSPNLIVRAREAARDFVLKNIHPTDLVAVAVHTVETGGRMLVTFTPDRAQVARAIDTLGAPRLVNLARRDPLLFLIDSPDNPNLAATSDLFDTDDSGATNNALQESVAAHLRVIGRQIEKMERSFSRGRVSSWSRSMGDLARFMDSVRGRKHVVYFSEGFDGSLLLGRQPSANDAQLQQDLANIQGGQLGLIDTDDIYGNVGLQNEMARMLEEFRRADAIIHAVDISGLRADSEAAERARSVGQDALFYIANDTGGQLYQDVTDFGEDLSRVLAKTEVTYLLTFQASDVVPDGSYHRINVKARTEKKVKLVHRDGFYAPRPFDELHPLEKSLLAADAIASAADLGTLSLNVLVAPFKANMEAAYVPIIIEVGGQELLFGQKDDQMSVEFYAYVTDADGAMKDFFTQLVTLDLQNGRSSFSQTGLKYYGHMDLAPGEYLVRVLVRNAETGMVGAESVPLVIPEFDVAEPFLLPPFFLEGEREWFLVREQDPNYQRSIVYPFTVNGNPYIPAAGPALRNDDLNQLCLVAYNLGDGSVEVSGRILAEDGQLVDGGQLALVERTVTGIAGLDKLLATFSTSGLDVGRYTLLVDVMERATGSMETNSIDFTVYN